MCKLSYILCARVYTFRMNTVDTYINQFDAETKARLGIMRQLVRAEAPEAEEAMAYGMVGYKLNKKPLVYFGGFAHHIGFYATPNSHEAFKDEFKKYKQGKGSVQFPLGEGLPLELIRRVVRYREKNIRG